MKNYSRIPELIFKRISESISDKEFQELENWINLSEENKRIYEVTINDDNIKSALKKYFKYDVDSAWIKTEKRLIPKSNTIKLLSNKVLRYAALLSIPLLIAGYLTILFISDSDNNVAKSMIELPFKPGNQKAILTLNNGQEVAVGKQQLAESIKVSELIEVIDSNFTLIYDNENIASKTLEYNTLQTPKGGEYSLVLADGSKVWLNADSKLKYPVAFSDTVRQVFIEGEAYFEIAENKNKPFIVQTNSYSINVLGTSFNVMAYNDEHQVVTTLIEGSVKITQSESSINLIPGQQAVLEEESDDIKVATVDTYQYTSWKDGLFVFKSESLSSIVKKFSRWYDCEIQFVDTDLGNKRFTGTLKRDTDLEKLLNIISQTCQIDFKVNKNNVLTISKKK